MTRISAKVVADSKNQFGNRITTMVVTFPRYILAELNTHRMFSRNSASSRAIPFEKMLESVTRYPFIPIAFQKDHKGMQGTEYFTEKAEIENRTNAWLMGKEYAIRAATMLGDTLMTTKQLANRILEPYMWHTVIITATEWENFFALRCPRYTFHNTVKESVYRSKKDAIKDLGAEEPVEYESGNVLLKDLSTIQWLQLNTGAADIHMMALAEAMWDAYNESNAKQLNPGEWHIPFGDNVSLNIADVSNLWDGGTGEKGLPTPEFMQNLKLKIAVARCARISYTVIGEENKPMNHMKDIQLHDNLASMGHWSPFEHCAQAMTHEELQTHLSGVVKVERAGRHLYVYELGESPECEGWSGNFRGFIQYRKTFQNENITVKNEAVQA